MKTKILILAVALILLSFAPVMITAFNVNTDQDTSSLGYLSDYAIMTLNDDPLASYDGHIPGYARTMPLPGNKLDLNSPAAQAYASYLGNGRGLAKGWLKNNAAEVQVIAEQSVVLNALVLKLNGHNMNHLWNAPGAKSLHLDYLYTVSMNRSPALINAPVLWGAVGGQTNAGAGIKIGIIDTGIDNTHPFLTDLSLSSPPGFPKCDDRDAAICGSLTSGKVIVAKVFQLAQTNFDAHAAQDHGTHVSGIAAGVAGTPCGAGFASNCTLSGIAPKAWLGNYNVFPGTVIETPSHTIAKAVEAGVSDGMDVLNLSLGGPAKPDDVLVNAVDHAVDAGLVVAIAAGNTGPGAGTVESPGIADKVITVGASTNPHFLGITVTVPSLGPLGAALGQFNNFVPPINTTYTLTTPSNGCTAITGSFTGKIALIRRGACTFTTKIRNAQTAGAMGVLVINNVAGDPVAMAHDGTSPFPTIPAAMVSITNGNAMVAVPPPGNVALVDGTVKQEFFSDGAGADILAGFSSRGPPLIESPGVGASSTQNKIKPDVTAPGVNVYSSILPTSCSTPPCYAFFSGTSMATPHVAGSAALLKQLHPTWSPEQIKSALVNSAKRPVKNPSSLTGAALNNPMSRGAGRIDLAAAATVTATIETDHGLPSVSFGTLPSSGISRYVDITLTSVALGMVTYTLTSTLTGPTLTTSASVVTVIPGGFGSFRATLTISPTVAVGDYFGDIVISGGAVTLKIPIWVRVDVPPGLQGPGKPHPV